MVFKKKRSMMHFMQGISLLVATGLLWLPWFDKTLMLGISSGIIATNAIIEIVS